jgi:pimeloyl-ACP methyl ester carboxylesterase
MCTAASTQHAQGVSLLGLCQPGTARQARLLSALGGREDNFVAGVSMGGYGALKLALILPERFAAAASLSGVTDVAQWADEGTEDFELVFGTGEPRRGSAHDLFQLATSLANSDRPKPRLYQCCGTEDSLHAQNLRFRDAIQDLDFDYLYPFLARARQLEHCHRNFDREPTLATKADSADQRETRQEV